MSGKMSFFDVFLCCLVYASFLCLCYPNLGRAVSARQSGFNLEKGYYALIVADYVDLTGARLVVPLKYLVALLL